MNTLRASRKFRKYAKLAVVGALFVLPFQLYGQNKGIDELFEKYGRAEGFTSVFISEYMFSMFQDVDTKDKALDETLDNLKGMKILTCELESGSKQYREFEAEVNRLVPRKDYKPLMVVREEDEEVEFLVKEAEGKIHELVMIVKEEDEFVFLYLSGIMDIKNLSKIAGGMNIDGMEKLEDLDE